MSDFALLNEAKPKARKPHKCIWCGEQIPVGEQYLFQSIRWDGTAMNQHWHFECADAQQEEGRERGDWEFSPYDNERPARAALKRAQGGETA
jgi:hypothetical protein